MTQLLGSIAGGIPEILANVTQQAQRRRRDVQSGMQQLLARGFTPEPGYDPLQRGEGVSGFLQDLLVGPELDVSRFELPASMQAEQWSPVQIRQERVGDETRAIAYQTNQAGQTRKIDSWSVDDQEPHTFEGADGQEYVAAPNEQGTWMAQPIQGQAAPQPRYTTAAPGHTILQDGQPVRTLPDRPEARYESEVVEIEGVPYIMQINQETNEREFQRIPVEQPDVRLAISTINSLDAMLAEADLDDDQEDRLLQIRNGLLDALGPYVTRALPPPTDEELAAMGIGDEEPPEPSQLGDWLRAAVQAMQTLEAAGRPDRPGRDRNLRERRVMRRPNATPVR